MSSNLLSNIPGDQNSPWALARLAAQRGTYKKARRVGVVRMVTMVVLPLLLTVLVSKYTSLKVWAALIGIVLPLADRLWLESWRGRLLKEGSALQEQFDCSVLNLEWPQWKAGAEPRPEDVAKARVRFLADSGQIEHLKDWYPQSARELPSIMGRLLCQYVNIWWDFDLRREYLAILRAALISLLLLLVGLAIHLGLSMQDFVLFLAAPLAPMFHYGIQKLKEQSNAVARLNRLRNAWDAMWKQSLNRADVNGKGDLNGRCLQDAILDHRQFDGPIPEYFYWRRRQQMEAQMKELVEERLREAEVRKRNG